MVGQMLVPKLINYGAKVIVSSMDSKNLCPKGVKKFYKLDLTFRKFIKVTKGVDIVLIYLGLQVRLKLIMRDLELL